jgi:hypothetical protein
MSVLVIRKLQFGTVSASQEPGARKLPNSSLRMDHMDGVTPQATASNPVSEKRYSSWRDALLVIAIIAMFLPFIVGLFLPPR